MQYKPKKIPEGINSSEESPLHDAFFIVCLMTGITMVSLALVVSLSGYLVQFFPLELEASYFQKSPIDDSTDDRKKLQALVDKLWAHFPEATKTGVHVDIKSTDRVNAFMAPGGNMTLTTGLLENLKSENEIAFVICHELGHFYNRDVVLGLSRRIAIATTLSFLGFNDSLDIVSASTASLNLVFDRAQEKKADEFALRCMNNQFGHVKGYDAFFNHAIGEKKLGKMSRKFLSFMQTHPLTEDRIANLTKKIEKMELSLKGKLTPY